MPASSAHVPTDRASRYLIQLCNHGSLMNRIVRHRPPVHGHRHGDGSSPPIATAASSGTEGVIDFGWGRCTLHATIDTLTLRAEASDPRHLQQIQDGITARLQRIGRRDQLSVAWTQETGT
jgi:hypothetical protein